MLVLTVPILGLLLPAVIIATLMLPHCPAHGPALLSTFNVSCYLLLWAKNDDDDDDDEKGGAKTPVLCVL